MYTRVCLPQSCSIKDQIRTQNKMRFSQFSETVSLLTNVNPELMVYDFFIIIPCKCARTYE